MEKLVKSNCKFKEINFNSKFEILISESLKNFRENDNIILLTNKKVLKRTELKIFKNRLEINKLKISGIILLD